MADQVAAIQATQSAGQDAAGAGDGAYQISLPNEAYGTKMTRQEHKLLLQTAVANAGRVFKDGTITFGVEAIMWLLYCFGHAYRQHYRVPGSFCYVSSSPCNNCYRFCFWCGNFWHLCLF